MFDLIETNSRIEKIGRLILELIEYDNCRYEIKVKGKREMFIFYNKDKAIDFFEEKKDKLLRENILNSLN